MTHFAALYLLLVTSSLRFIFVMKRIQAYSYRYNIKIVGVPEKGTNKSADETSGICVALFREMGADVSINDIDTAHRVPGRNNSNHDSRPKAIICKFVRRLARDKVMAKRADANKANPTALGFRDNVSLTAVRVFEHLTPRLQEVLYEANKFKTQPLQVLLGQEWCHLSSQE